MGRMPARLHERSARCGLSTRILSRREEPQNGDIMKVAS